MSEEYAYKGDPLGSPKRYCRVCGKTLSAYNRNKQCFHHAVDETVRQERKITTSVAILPVVRTAVRSGPPKVKRIVPKPAVQQAARQTAVTSASALELPKRRFPSQKAIASVVCTWFGVEFEDVVREDKHARISHIRNILMYLLYKDSAGSYQSVVEFLNRKNHTTAVAAVKKIETLCSYDRRLRCELWLMRRKYRIK